MRKSIFKKHFGGDTNTRVKGNGLIEDATEYGEFIASFDDWMTPEEQKKRAEHLQNIEKNKKS